MIALQVAILQFLCIIKTFYYHKHGDYYVFTDLTSTFSLFLVLEAFKTTVHWVNALPGGDAAENGIEVVAAQREQDG